MVPVVTFHSFTLLGEFLIQLRRYKNPISLSTLNRLQQLLLIRSIYCKLTERYVLYSCLVLKPVSDFWFRAGFRCVCHIAALLYLSYLDVVSRKRMLTCICSIMMACKVYSTVPGPRGFYHDSSYPRALPPKTLNLIQHCVFTFFVLLVHVTR